MGDCQVKMVLDTRQGDKRHQLCHSPIILECFHSVISLEDLWINSNAHTVLLIKEIKTFKGWIQTGIFKSHPQ